MTRPMAPPIEWPPPLSLNWEPRLTSSTMAQRLNINENCGSQHTQDLEKRVKETGAAIGLAFDGDGDRLIAVDEKGRTITGDQS